MCVCVVCGPAELFEMYPDRVYARFLSVFLVERQCSSKTPGGCVMKQRTALNITEDTVVLVRQ